MPKGYFCTQCNRRHYSGKKYLIHKKYEKHEPDNIPSKKLLKCNWEQLRPIAQRQIMHYIDKMVMDKTKNNSKNRELYIHEINRVIIHEDDNIPIKL